MDIPQKPMTRGHPGPGHLSPMEVANKTFGGLKLDRTDWEPTWLELRKFLAPKRGDFDDNSPNHRGSRDDTQIYNMTPARALRTLSAGLHSGVTNPSRPWMRLVPGDPDRAEDPLLQEWLDKVEKVLYRIFARSNLYHVLPSLYKEFGGFGTGCMIVEEDYRTVIRCRPLTVGSYYLGQDESGRVNTLARTIWMTVDQMVSMFGYEAVPERIRQAYNDKNLLQWHQVNHLIEPNRGRDAASKMGRHKPYRSLYWLKGDSANTGTKDPDGFLLRGGYDEFPCMAPRWETVGDAVYGCEAPGWVGIGDAKMLQTQAEDWLEASDQALHPAITAPASLMGQGVDLLPGGTNYIADDSQVGINPIGSAGLNLEASLKGMEMTKQDIREAFFVDLFLMFNNLQGPEKTAREIVERSSEKLLMLGPMLQRTYSELLDPLIDRTFNIAWRAGILPPPPEGTTGTDLRVEYTSVLAQAQKMVGTTSLEQFAGFVGNVAGVRPDVLDKVDTDQLIDEYGDMLGVPAKIIVPDEEVDAIRRQRAQQQQAQQAMAMAQQGAATAKDLGNVPVGQNSALDALLNGGRAG